MLFKKRIAIIGSGNMGKALLGGILKAKLTPPENIIATDVHPGHLEKVEQQWKVKTTTNNVEAVKFADVIILCIKPQTIREVLEEIKVALDPTQLIITIVAGIKTEMITEKIGKNNPIIRGMPNIAALVDEAAIAICSGKYANSTHMEMAKLIFDAVGEVVVVQEKLMDAVTGLSGSGPAYIYMVIEALTDGGVLMGLSREVATQLATQTVLGSAKLVRETGMHPAVLRDQVTTPGGTTITAIHDLESHGLRPMLISAVATATKKSQQLGEMLRNKVS
ncbi:pyrroline-5-carboxylate reductase [candidate division KSB1 bacterium]|nr:pyrroline-5-carboxylate reductase [bacterium]OQX58538.1 MAG: pyrroline-5-carboxylate reductase [candidate division KSB1 bacterium 4484_219]RKY78268.1 MAG: pyrroline-5-carboxylate reductase [candidate division KSB1 bacterium]HDI52151.1 pyrroline-5-carboxylate reductase [Bacteroidota bacterium]RKY78742.1 MAG: pyrroline-5-carboxylate reductase [candidate division KSB1 bacterium]